MSLYAPAQQQLVAALSLSRRALGPENPATLAIMVHLAKVYDETGKYAEAEKLYSQAAEAAGRVLGKQNRRTLVATAGLAFFYSEEGNERLSQAGHKDL